MFGLVKMSEFKKFKGGYADLCLKFEALNFDIQTHILEETQERCEHKNKEHTRYFIPSPPSLCETPVMMHKENCADCGKELWSDYGRVGGTEDTEWQKRKLNYEKEVHRKKLIAVREQIKILEEEKEK